jgi:hypothetical protein
MPKRRKNKKTASNLEELVVIAFVETLDEAREFESLLKNNDIPAMVKKHNEDNSSGSSIAVMVPEEYADEAQVIIESQSSFDDLYEMTNDEDEFGSDPIEDEF